MGSRAFCLKHEVLGLDGRAFCSGGEALSLGSEAFCSDGEGLSLNDGAIALAIKEFCWVNCDRCLDYCGIL